MFADLSSPTLASYFIANISSALRMSAVRWHSVLKRICLHDACAFLDAVGCNPSGERAVSADGRIILPMKEKITLRLYESKEQGAVCHAGMYQPDVSVKGWDYARGETIGLTETHGGFLYGVIDEVDPEIHEDQVGRYRLASLWTQD